MKYRSIVISGQIASGTSTTSESVSKKLGIKYKSAGDFFREYMKKNDIPLYDKAQVPDEIEKQIDEEFSKLTDSPIVIDAHYAGYFNRDKNEVLKVLLTCDEQERIKRALSRQHTHTEGEGEIKLREEGLDKKFRKLYAGEDYLDPKFFNLIIDTTNTSPEEVSEKIIKEFSA